MRVDQQVDPGCRRHGGRYLGHGQAPALHDLASAREGQQADDGEVRGGGGADAAGALEGGGGEDEERLGEVAEDEPQAQAGPAAGRVAELAGQVGPGQEEAQRGADVARVEDLAVELGQDGSDGEEDGVAGLVGSEAAVVGEGDCIFFPPPRRWWLVIVSRGW